MSNKSITYLLLILATVLTISCSAAKDLTKQVEGNIYDSLAGGAAKYCKRVQDKGLVIQRTRIEARREVRQRGTNGPEGPQPPIEGLDDKTAYGSGPVIVIYCQHDKVPRQVYENMIRDWKD